MSNHLKAFFTLLFCGLIYGTFGLFVRILGKSFGPFEQILVRNIIGATIGIVLILVTKTKLQYLKVPKKDLILFSITFPCTVILFTLAVGYSKVSTITFLFYASSLITSYIVGIKVFGEKITMQKNIALIFCLIGLCFYMLPLSFEKNMVGVGLILTAGIVDTFSSMYKKKISGIISNYALIPLPLMAGAVISGLIIILFKIPLHPALVFQIPNFPIFLFYGFSILLMNALILYGFRHFDLNLGTLVLSSELVFATLVGLIFLFEIPSTKEIIGGMCIILAIFVANWPLKAYAKN